jgi:hypothetical protein
MVSGRVTLWFCTRKGRQHPVFTRMVADIRAGDR